MKVVAVCLSLVASAAAFSQPETSSRRDAIAKAAGLMGAAFVPAVAEAAVGESPRFSVFGLIGDGSSYSEGAAYGTDQSKPLYSPYSVYSEEGDKSLYRGSADQAGYKARKKAIIAESKKRIAKLPAYIERKEWFNVIDELDRYMYETRGAVRGLAADRKSKKAAEDFFKAIEDTNLQARLKNQAACEAAAKAAASTLDAFDSIV